MSLRTILLALVREIPSARQSLDWYSSNRSST